MNRVSSLMNRYGVSCHPSIMHNTLNIYAKYYSDCCGINIADLIAVSARSRGFLPGRRTIDSCSGKLSKEMRADITAQNKRRNEELNRGNGVYERDLLECGAWLFNPGTDVPYCRCGNRHTDLGPKAENQHLSTGSACATNRSIGSSDRSAIRKCISAEKGYPDKMAGDAAWSVLLGIRTTLYRNGLDRHTG